MPTPVHVVEASLIFLGCIGVGVLVVARTVGFNPGVGVRHVSWSNGVRPIVTRNGRDDARSTWSLYLAFGAMCPWIMLAAGLASDAPWSWTGSPWPWVGVAWSLSLMATSWHLGTRAPKGTQA